MSHDDDDDEGNGNESFLQDVNIVESDAESDHIGPEFGGTLSEHAAEQKNIDINKMYSDADDDNLWLDNENLSMVTKEDTNGDILQLMEDKPFTSPPADEDQEKSLHGVVSSHVNVDNPQPDTLDVTEDIDGMTLADPHEDAETREEKKIHATLERRHTEVFGETTDADSLLHTYSATTLANEWSTLEWKTYDSEMTYTIKYIPSTPEDSLAYMNRFNEGAYEEACGKEFTLMMFPPDNSVLQYFPHLIATHEVLGFSLKPNTDVSFRMIFLFMNHLIKAIRLQKLLLLQEYQKLKDKIVIFKEFLVLCNKKMAAQKHRLGILENELVLHEPYPGFSPGSLLGSFLSSAVGWVAIQTFFEKELKYLQNLIKEKVKMEEKERVDLAKAAKKEANRLKKEEATRKQAEDNGSIDSSAMSSLETGSGPVKGTPADQSNAVQRQASGVASVETETESMIIEKILNRQGLGLSRDEMEEVRCLVRYWQVVNSGEPHG